MPFLKHLPIQSFNENIAYISKDFKLYQAEDIRAETRVEIKGGAKSVFASLNITNDRSLLLDDEIGLNDEAFQELDLPQGANVSIHIAQNPESMSLIVKKLQGKPLSQADFLNIVSDINAGKLLSADIALFLAACRSNMSIAEIVFLAKALSGGKILYWDEEDIVVDHKTLGTACSNATELPVMAITAAYGLPMPKSVCLNPYTCLGTGHMMRVFANIDLDLPQLADHIHQNRAVVFNADLLPMGKALKRMRTLARFLNLKSESLSIAQMLAFEIASGVTHLLVDIPLGPDLIARNGHDTARIRKIFEYASSELNMHIETCVTDGREPVGNSIGAALEARDVMRLLKNADTTPPDLKEKVLFLASKVLAFDPKLYGGKGLEAAEEILTSSRALKAFNRIVEAQGAETSAELGQLTSYIPALKSGRIKSINNQTIQKISVLAGSVEYASAGVYLFKKVGDLVEKGEALYKIYASNASDFALANANAEQNSGYEIV